MNTIAQQALERARARSSNNQMQDPTPRRRFWTTTEESRLAALYAATPMSQLIELLGRPKSAIYGKAKELGLKRSAEFLASEHSGRLRTDSNPGLATRFQKGHGTWNKGKPFAAGGRSAETQFTTGRQPHNQVPIGTEVMASDGYMKIKVAEPNKWEWTHRRNWEAVHGAIPKEMVLVFKTADHTDCSIDNLELITRRELMSRNTIQRFPPELKQTIRLLGKLKRTIEATNE